MVPDDVDAAGDGQDPDGVDQAVRAEISRQVRDLLEQANLSAQDRSKLRTLVGFMSEDAPEEYDDFMLMYLSGDRDWREDYAEIFGD